MGVGGDDDLQPGNVGEQAFRALAVGLAAEDAAAIGGADGQGRGELAGGAVAQLGRLRHDLVIGGIDVVGELDLHHRPQAIGPHADGGPDNAAFRDRRIEAAGQAVLLLQTVRHPEHPAEIAHVLAQDQHLRVPFQHDVEGRVQGLDHVHGGHDQTPSCWRWRRRRQSGWANTSSNRVREDTRDWPSVPTASASRAAARTASCASCSAD